MTREEEKEHQSYLYTKLRCDLVEIPDWEEVEFGFQAGVEYADEHPIHRDDQAITNALQKGVEQGKKEMLEKVCDFIKENIDHYIGFYLNDGDTYLDDSFFEDLMKYIEEFNYEAD